MAAKELDDPAASEMASVVQEMRLGQPLDRALERLQERLPSREVAVLMTTIVIQQRAGGDTVRALQELGGTLEARKDLIREIRTCCRAPCSRPTSSRVSASRRSC